MEVGKPSLWEEFAFKSLSLKLVIPFWDQDYLLWVPTASEVQFFFLYFRAQGMLMAYDEGPNYVFLWAPSKTAASPSHLG